MRSVAHEMFTKALRQGVFTLRVHDGQRVWRLPERAFEGSKPGLDLEMTWTAGRLWDFDAASDFRSVAELRLPLLTTEEDAAAFRAKILTHIEEMEARPEESAPEASEEQLVAWIAEWSAKPRWAIREALLWVSLRDLNQVAIVASTSAWAGNERQGLAGAVLARADINGQRRWRRVFEAEPEPHLIRALQNGLPASGLFEGQMPSKPIAAMEWDNLEFGVLPSPQRGQSDAYKSSAMASGQVHGVAWRGHWTGVGIDRVALFAAFEPEPMPTEQLFDSQEAVDATIRCLVAQAGGYLPLNKGADRVWSAHPSRGKRELRDRIRELYPIRHSGRRPSVPIVRPNRAEEKRGGTNAPLDVPDTV